MEGNGATWWQQCGHSITQSQKWKEREMHGERMVCNLHGSNKAETVPWRRERARACIHWPVLVVGEGLHTQLQPTQLHIPRGQDPPVAITSISN